MFAVIKRIAQLILNLGTIRMSQTKNIIAIDKRFNETFRFDGKEMPATFRRQPEWVFVVTYRKFQENRNNIVGAYYRRKLAAIEL